MNKTLLFISLIILHIGSCNNDIPQPTDVSFSMDKGLPIIACTLNGKDAKLLIDTGAMASVLNIHSAREYNFLYTAVSGNNYRGVGNNIIRGGLVSDYIITVNDIELQIDFKGLELGTFSHDLGVVGILGSDFFRDHNYAIDYSSNKLIQLE